MFPTFLSHFRRVWHFEEKNVFRNNLNNQKYIDFQNITGNQKINPVIHTFIN